MLSSKPSSLLLAPLLLSCVSFQDMVKGFAGVDHILVEGLAWLQKTVLCESTSVPCISTAVALQSRS